MFNWKKIIGICICVFACISVAGNITAGIGWKRADKRADEYRATVNIVEGKLRKERERNKIITDLNISIGAKLDDSIERAGAAEEALGRIGDSLSGDIGTIDEIIESVRGIIQALQEYYNA